MCLKSLRQSKRGWKWSSVWSWSRSKNLGLWSQWRLCCALNRAGVPDCLYLSRGERAVHISCKFEAYGPWLKTFVDGKWHHTCGPTLTRARDRVGCKQQSTLFHTRFSLIAQDQTPTFLGPGWQHWQCQHWFQQSKKFMCSFPISQSPHGYLCTVPSTCSYPCPLPSQTRLDVGEAAPLLPGKQFQCSHQPEWPPQQAVQMHPWHAGEAPNAGGILAGDWAATSMLIRMWQQDQTCKVQWQIGEQLSRWELAVTLPFASGNYNITHAFTQVLWPYCTIGLFLWGFLLQLNGVTGIKEFDKKTKNSWHCSSYFSSPETYMHHI